MNLGFGGIVLDPLALTRVDSKGETAQPRAQTAFVFGGYVRLGIAHSPVNLVAMATYQPWLRPLDDCTSGGRCWSGAWQIGVGLAVDVPILVLK